MFSIRNVAMAVSMATLAACSSTTSTPTPFTPAISGTAQVDASGNISVTQNGATRTPGTTGISIGGTPFYAFVSSSFGVAYHTADVTAVAGRDSATPNATYAGISGTLSTTVPTTGFGTYTGDFNMSYHRGGTTNSNWWAHGAFTTYVDFNAGTLAGSGTGATGTGSAGSNLTVSGTLQGAQFNGSAYFTAPDFAGATGVPMTGGIYGTNTVAGIIQNANVAGVFYGN
jgi:hypothetical protein